MVKVARRTGSLANGDARSHADSAPHVPGAQAIHRAASLLKQVACENARGVALGPLCEQVGLGMPTAHRILKSLVAEGLVAKDEATGRYRLGPVTYELGLAATPQPDAQELCAPALRRLAAATGDTVFLLVRSDLDGVCVRRCEGDFPIKVLTLDVGMRRPLGVSAGAVALLMGLPKSQTASILKSNAKRFAQFELGLDTAIQSLDDANRNGYAVNDELTVRGQRGVAMPCFARNGIPFAAFSIAAISARMSKTRISELVRLLRQETARIERELGSPI